MAIAELREALARLAAEAPIIEQRAHAAVAALRIVDARQPDAASVRDWILEMHSCSEAELADEFGFALTEAHEILSELARREIVRAVRGPWGKRWYYLEPEDDGPRSRPRRRPPEKEPPAMVDSKATGMPVRVSAQKRIGRQGRSTAHTGHLAKQRDRRYERMQEQKEKAAEVIKIKQQKPPKWKRKKK